MGIIHCDIKPQNIVMNERHQPVLLDFDVSKSAEKRSRAAADAQTTLLKATSPFTGRTLFYMAPEMDGHNAIPTSASDMYSLGLVVLDLLFPSEREGLPKHPIKLPPAANADAAELIRALLTPDPKQRPSARLLSVDEVPLPFPRPHAAEARGCCAPLLGLLRGHCHPLRVRRSFAPIKINDNANSFLFREIDVTKEMKTDVQELINATCSSADIGIGSDSHGLGHKGSFHFLKIL